MVNYLTAVLAAFGLSMAALSPVTACAHAPVSISVIQSTVTAAQPSVDMAALVRCLFGDLKDLDKLSITSRRDGSIAVQIRRSRTICETLRLQTPGGPAGPVCHGMSESMTMRPLQGGIMIDNIQGVSVAARGPLGAVRMTYTKSSYIALDSQGKPYFSNTSVYQGPLGRWRSSSTILTKANLPNSRILAALEADAGNLERLVSMIKGMQNVDGVNFAKQPDGSTKMTIELKKAGDLTVNKKVGSHELKSISFTKQVTCNVEDNGTTTKFTNIADVKVTVATIIGDVTLAVRSITMETGADGKRQVKLEVDNPLVSGRTITITMPADKLQEAFGAGKP